MQQIGFEPRTLHLGFVVDKVALEQVFLRVSGFSQVSTIPPGFHPQLHLDSRTDSVHLTT
jgi:hypothetical protein